MVMVSELALLDLKDALKLALVQSGKTPLEVAREMGWSAHHAKQVFGLNDYIPSARAFPGPVPRFGKRHSFGLACGKRQHASGGRS